MSKIEFPEILIKIATTIRVNKDIERTGTDWLECVLRHFGKTKKIDIVTKDLSRTSVKAILSTCEASETVKTIVINNYDVMRWSIYGKAFKTISIRPRWLKSIKDCQVQVRDDSTAAAEITLNAFNQYMTATATKYNSSLKLNSLYEALALNNIMLIKTGNSFGVDKENWNNPIYKTSVK
ncbi:hypothetical protein EDC94DRAFT_151896 [Helicostylum pulchrum]|nr:hypothetical protein EDC94DRAFT_151896 [Helicostylum pulchrum]